MFKLVSKAYKVWCLRVCGSNRPYELLFSQFFNSFFLPFFVHIMSRHICRFACTWTHHYRIAHKQVEAFGTTESRIQSGAAHSKLRGIINENCDYDFDTTATASTVVRH